MIRFEHVPTELVMISESTKGFDQVRRACVVRDLRGRVRLVLEGSVSPKLIRALEPRLIERLGGYFQSPIWQVDAGPPDHRRLAGKLFDLAEPWSPSWEDPATGEVRQAAACPWSMVERRLSKQAWLHRPGDPPWPLRTGQPAVVAFYSFKGGVGRTTALVSCAWQLAEAGFRVAVVDLDLEAPSLGGLMAEGAERGVLDYLVDHLATGSGVLDGLSVSAQGLGDVASRVFVYSAGALDRAYVEKLGRLDFSEEPFWASEAETHTEQALHSLFKQIKGESRPDYILIDSRTGFHDVAGLALTRLSHVAVLFSRASEQGYRGLELTVQLLSSPSLRCAVAHSMAPARRDSEEERMEREAFRMRSYDIFLERVYKEHFEDRDIPSVEAEDGLHSPLVLHYDEALRNLGHLAGVRDQLFSADYKALMERVRELCSPEDVEA